MTYLFAIMGRQHRKCWHSVDGKWFRYSRRERLSEEGNSTFRFATWREELALETFVALRDEERRSAKTSTTSITRFNLMIEKFLNVLDRKEMLAIHRDNDGVPDLRNKHLFYIENK